MRVPLARESKYGPWAKWDSTLTNPDGTKVGIEYDNTTPLGGIRTFPCAGKKPGPIVGTYAAGESIPVMLEGTIWHDGGHCQFALSYDNGESWVVIKTVYRECLRNATQTQYLVTIPSGAPSALRAVFMWSWLNAVGNREFYVNCADIAIQGVSPGRLEGRQLLVANYAPPVAGTVMLPEFPGRDTASCDGKLLLDSRPRATLDVSTGKVNPPGLFLGKELESRITSCDVKYISPPGADEDEEYRDEMAQPPTNPSTTAPSTAAPQLSSALQREASEITSLIFVALVLVAMGL